MTYTEDRDTFERMLLVGSDPKRPHTAAQAERAQRFIGGLDDAQRTAFLEAALDFAWNARNTFNVRRESIGMFWTRALRQAALSREKWLVSVAVLPGVFHKRWVLGTVLAGEG